MRTAHKFSKQHFLKERKTKKESKKKLLNS